ncbi:Carboxylesterase family-domain-containing protein, partial [Hygrophoropsis aurantiaca]
SHCDPIQCIYHSTPPYSKTALNAFSESFMSFVMTGNVNTKLDPMNITPYWNEYFIGETEMLFNETEAYESYVVPVTAGQGLPEHCSYSINFLAMASCEVDVPNRSQQHGCRSVRPHIHDRICILIGAEFLGHLDIVYFQPSYYLIAVSAPIVDLGYAQYQGALDTTTNITSFLSIRYAAPPLGDLRFQAPQPPLTAAGVQQATMNPDSCYQTGFGASNTAPVSIYGFNKRQSTTPTSSEDCLYLNVFVPGEMPAEPAAPGTGLPVLVWIHGGGYVAGYAEEFDGADLVADSHNGVVTVVMQYRLGAFGFLSGNEVKASGALNAGLLDQTFALQWVQDHIALFGGDASHVTIWGESAGAGSVLQHIVANGGNTQPPLFSGAITSSTFLPSQYYYND